MKDENSIRKIDILLDKLISEKLVRHTCQFFEKGEDGLKPFGSGVFALIHDTHFILTASHVAEALKDDKDLYIRVGKKSYINVLGEIKFTDLDKSQGIDIAYIKVDSQMIEPLSKPHLFLTIDKIRRHNNLVNAMNYCVIGFPENNVRKDKGYMDTGAAAYFTTPANDKPYINYGYDKKDWFIVEMKGKGTDIKTGLKGKVNTHFNGLSGCGLWYLIIEQDQITGEYFCDYRLIGIMTEYKKGKYFCLIGNKIQLLLDALRVIEKIEFKEININN